MQTISRAKSLTLNIWMSKKLQWKKYLLEEVLKIMNIRINNITTKILFGAGNYQKNGN